MWREGRDKMMVIEKINLLTFHCLKKETNDKEFKLMNTIVN